jgi:agmatine deiminase
VLAKFIHQLVAAERIHLCIWDAEMEQWVRAQLRDLRVATESIAFHQFPALEPWIRDHGPTFLVRQNDRLRERALVDWVFNAWGGRQTGLEQDDLIPHYISHLLRLPMFAPGRVLEGGAIEVNGAGSVLVTESCLLNPNRNPGLSRSGVEDMLRDYLGVSQVCWLAGGLSADDADGHVEHVARFVDPQTILAAVQEDPSDEDYAVLQENLQRLRGLRDPAGRLFRVVPLPLPSPVEYGGRRLPASYTGFYIANGLVVAPTYRDPNDNEALTLLRRLCSDRRVVGIDATDLVWGGGTFHSLALPEPA